MNQLHILVYKHTSKNPHSKMIMPGAHVNNETVTAHKLMVYFVPYAVP